MATETIQQRNHNAMIPKLKRLFNKEGAISGNMPDDVTKRDSCFNAAPPMTPCSTLEKVAIDKLKQEFDLFDMLHFKDEPSDAMCQLYQFARDEGSAGFVECWLALRTHHMLYRRYKTVKQLFWHSERTISADDFEGVPEFRVDEQQELGLMQLMAAGNINDMYVDKPILRQSATFILSTFLLDQECSPKAIDLPADVVAAISEQVFEKRVYQPTIFKQVREHLYLCIEKGIYRRFLQHIHDEQ